MIRPKDFSMALFANRWDSKPVAVLFGKNYGLKIGFGDDRAQDIVEYETWFEYETGYAVVRYRISESPMWCAFRSKRREVIYERYA